MSLFQPKTATIAYIAIAPRMLHYGSRLAEPKQLAEVHVTCARLPFVVARLGQLETPRTKTVASGDVREGLQVHTFSAFWL